MNMYVMRDDCADSYGAPITVENDGLAMRSLQMALANEGSPLANSPSDFRLFCIGTYDPSTASIEVLNPSRFVCCAASLVRPSGGNDND